jgi:hypothetical protein
MRLYIDRIDRTGTVTNRTIGNTRSDAEVVQCNARARAQNFFVAADPNTRADAHARARTRVMARALGS